MSQKITPKNLQYNSSLPPFLARLRGETAPSEFDGPDPILAGRRRPAKPRNGSAEAEDAPVVVDERGEVVDVKVGLDGEVKVGLPAEEKGEGGDKGDGEEEQKKEGEEKEAGVGGVNKKRKGRVVGAEQGEEGEEVMQKEKKGEGEGKAKGKKKAKKIKLSFGDEEG
ncbi:hypothetical protein B0T14DRAFT_495161 [Immersiella caudata]|uniref:DUF4604 domain-containing protein n=1 Tax=Immersiella caudata TaxID=314043 RepID=A0AA39WYU9_9PEZI|nr:hypothetical protein B0T14DRAFT_495161 [Immersiella caudata]